MLRLTNILILLTVMGLLVVGCQNNPAPTNSQNVPTTYLAAKVKPATTATLESATFYVYVTQANNHTVNLHRITDPWVETEVTWNTFGGAYAPGVEGSFVAGPVGWQATDVTGLVQSWLDGTYDNYGMLLKHPVFNYPRASYSSRDAANNQPFLEICFATASGTECTNVAAVADAYIYESYPNSNTGTEVILMTGWGWETDREKQALVMFDLPEVPPDECGECEGKVTQLTLRYDGDIADAHVVIVQKRGKVSKIPFDGIVQPGEEFTFVGLDRKGTLGPEIDVYINGEYHTYIHTSCSQPIGPGLVRGDFTVIEGYSRKGGLLPPL